MFEILDNIYIDRFLLLAFAKYILFQIYSHFIRNCTLYTFWRLWKLFFFFFLKTPVTFLTQEWLVVAARASMNNIFNVLLICLQYTLLFKLPDFSLKCRFTITPNSQSLKFKASVLCEIFPFLKKAGIVIHFLNLLIVTELLLWNRKER